VVIGYISEHNAKKHGVSTGRLMPFGKIANKYHFADMMKANNGKHILSDIMFSHKEHELCSFDIGDCRYIRIPYISGIDSIIISINSEVFNTIYVPETNLKRKTYFLECIFRSFYEDGVIIENKKYKVTKGKYVFSNKKIDSICLFGDTIKLDEVYRYEFKDYPFPSCFIYSFNDDSKISIKNINKIV
jgi:hypothetical protein